MSNRRSCDTPKTCNCFSPPPPPCHWKRKEGNFFFLAFILPRKRSWVAQHGLTSSIEDRILFGPRHPVLPARQVLADAHGSARRLNSFSRSWVISIHKIMIIFFSWPFVKRVIYSFKRFRITFGIPRIAHEKKTLGHLFLAVAF